jgi:hypothetical protein
VLLLLPLLPAVQLGVQPGAEVHAAARLLLLCLAVSAAWC